MKKPQRKKKLLIALTATTLVLVLGIGLAIILPIVFAVEDQLFTIPALAIPIEDDYALTKYTYDQLDDVLTTVRSDAMTVTQRGLARTTPKMLSNDFSLVYDTAANKLTPKYEKYVSSGANEKVATVTFAADNYPEPYYEQTMTAAKAYAAAPDAIKSTVNETDYFAYYKYMLMTQGQHLALETATRVSQTASDSNQVNADFANWLTKHPMADGQYGAVKGENNAVEKQITLDPLYRSLHTTGLYLPAGEPVTIKIEGLKDGEQIGINLGSHDSMAWRGSVPNAETTIKEITGGKTYTQVNYQNANSDYFFKQADLVTAAGKFFENNSGENTPFLQSQWKRQNARAPWIQCALTFDKNKTYTIGYAFGGLIQIDMKNCYSNVKVTIKGAVETPHYILGVTTPEYFEKYLKDAPGVIAALDTENGILTGPTGELGNPRCANMRTVKKDEIDKLAMLWHSFLTVNETFTGGVYNRFNKVNFDWHVPAGAAVALGGYTFAQPTSWFTDAMNYQGLLQSGTWGTLHEIGHNHAAAYGVTWGFGTEREGEVRNNALTQLSYIQFLDTGTSVRNGTASVEHGEYSTPYNSLLQALNIPNANDFDDGSYDYFRCLGMYANIMHSFGADKYYELLYTYKLNVAYCTNKRADFAYRCAEVYGMNFIPYFNKLYHANITDAMFSDEQLTLMNSLPNYQPVANFYAGGIDGVKTAGDYLVTFGEDVMFDLTGKTISALDTANGKGFTITKVEQPLHGSIKQQDNQWIYSFNPDYSGATDNFSFIVKMNDGVSHRLTIFLRISYHGARLTKYQTFAAIDKKNGINDNTWPTVMATLPDLSSQVQTNATSAITNYQTPSGQWEVRVLEFYWQAPKTGTVTFNCKRDDGLKFYFGETFDTLTEQGCLSHDSAAWAPIGTKYVVEEGQYYAIKVLNVNTGGGGSASIAYQYEGETVTAIPAEQIYHPNFPLGQDCETFVFQPYYMVSKKDSIKLSTAGTDKTMWEVLQAPERIEGGHAVNSEGKIDSSKPGHYKVTTLSVIKVDAAGNYLDKNGVPILPTDADPNREPAREEFEVVTDYWQYLIDGDNGTYMHTAYSGGNLPNISADKPHEFIIDMKQVQAVNFFKVTTRNHFNSYIEDFELYLAGDKTAENTYDWQLVATGDRSNYKDNTISLRFDTCQARYLRLVVKKTSGGIFSVLSEIDAGVESLTQKLVPVASSKLFTTAGWQSTSAIESEPNGYLLAQSANAAAVVKFQGDSIALYAHTDVDGGKIKVIVDGKAAEVDLHSESSQPRKLVFYTDKLSDKEEHTMEIITMSNEKVVLNAIGLPYLGTLLNAPNIYLERALTIALIVFIILFVAVTAFLLCLLFIPKFRKFMGNNKMINALDRKLAANKAKRQVKREAKRQTKKSTVTKAAVKITTKPTTKTPTKTPQLRSTAKPTTTVKPIAKTETKLTTPKITSSKPSQPPAKSH